MTNLLPGLKLSASASRAVALFSAAVAAVLFFFERIFPWVVTVSGMSIVAWGVQGLLMASDSVEWPRAQGTIMLSKVRVLESYGSNGLLEYTYSADIQYRFVVQQREYTGARVAYGDFSSGSSSRFEEIVARYPTGRQVEVYYLPSDPAECVLEPGRHVENWAPIFSGGVLIMVGVGMTMFLSRALKRARARAVGYTGRHSAAGGRL